MIKRGCLTRRSGHFTASWMPIAYVHLFLPFGVVYLVMCYFGIINSLFFFWQTLFTDCDITIADGSVLGPVA